MESVHAEPTGLEEARRELESRVQQLKEWFRPDQLGTRKKGEPLCPICRKLLLATEAIAKGYKVPWFELGTRAELIDSKCDIHYPIISYVLNSPDREKDNQLVKGYISEMYFLGGGIRGSSLRISGEGHSLYFCSIQRPRKNLHNLGKVLNTSWIDINMIRSWKKQCETHHGKICEQSRFGQTLLTKRPRILVDLWRMCLVQADYESSYMALSYVWGKSKSFRTIKANFEHLQKANSLSVAIKEQKLPKTIEHAMHLTQTLKERYLWVDALCIVQDDEDTKYEQIEDMASIYANSVLTIIAGEGHNANYGIPGIRNISDPRECYQHAFKISKTFEVVQIPWPKISNTQWFSRGWTFQEYLFSPRRLVFGDRRLRWECNSNFWQEDIDHTTDSKGTPYLINEMAINKQLFLRHWPDLNNFMEVVRNYNTRQFTLPKDVALAFAGLTSVLSSKFDGGFLYGLPEMFFDIALLWQPAGILERRLCSRGASTSGPDSILPSWSWMGWRGEINSWSWHHGADFVKSADGRGETEYCLTSQRTTPILQWYYGGVGMPASERSAVNVTWKKYYNISREPGVVPPGWTHRFKWLEKQQAQYIYKHESDPETEFWYPVPIPNPAPSTCISIQDKMSSQLLFCYTRRAWLHPDVHFTSYRPSFSLRDNVGNWAGFMTVHDQVAWRLLQENEASTGLCELIAISAGCAFNQAKAPGLDEWELEDRPKDGPWYEFYNVLWIDWIDGIAYRKGLGRVLKSIWDSEDPEWIDVTLG